MKREEKKRIVEDFHERASRATFVVVTDFKGLDVAIMSELRRSLREASSEYQVVKNTLLQRASEGTDLALMKDHFVGPCALALTHGDPVETAKALTKFASEQAAFEIKAGVLGGRVIDATAIKSLSILPAREVLLAQLLATMNA
ncbi:50S ribosomal protein L10, partial [Thermodesulfobacteriota bacterium]